MDYSKFPHHRGMPRSLQGERQARFLDTLGAPALHHANLDGSRSSKVGGRLYVDPAQNQAEDGYYSAGAVGNGSIHVVGSPTALGAFLDRGVFGNSVDYVNTDIRQMFYYGAGLGAMIRVAYRGTTPDFNGMPSIVAGVSVHKTPNGRTFEQVYETYASVPYVSSTRSYNAAIFATGPTLVRQGVVGWRYIGLGAVQFLDGQYQFVYIVDDGISRGYGNTLTIAWQLPLLFEAWSTAPEQRFALGKYLRPEYNQAGMPHPINVAACPGVDFQFSDDSGMNWVRAAALPVMAEFTETALALPADSVPAAIAFNTAVNWVHVNVAPVSKRYAVAIISVPYIEVDASLPTGYRVHAKVKLARIDHEERTIVQTAVLQDFVSSGADDWDSGAENAAAFANGGCVPIAGGALFVLRPPGQADYRDNTAVCLFTTDGYDLQYQPSTGWPGWQVGIPFAIDERTLALPVFRAEPVLVESGGAVAAFGQGYTLTQSTDLGATWKQRAVLSVNAPAPVKQLGVSYLRDFAIITQLRAASFAANATPGAPWISDSRYPAPSA